MKIEDVDLRFNQIEEDIENLKEKLEEIYIELKEDIEYK